MSGYVVILRLVVGWVKRRRGLTFAPNFSMIPYSLARLGNQQQGAMAIMEQTASLYRAAALAAALCLLTAYPARADHAASSPAEGQFESAAVCKECHEDIYKNWRGSLHALALTNPIFQTAYQRAYTQTGGEAKKYCLRCHAPTVTLTGDYDARQLLTREGVTCDFCHAVTKIDLGAKDHVFTVAPGKIKRSSLKNAVSPHHETRHSDDFASSKLCAGCHAFVNRHGVQVGNTFAEWQKSGYAKEGRQCQSCHMAVIPGKTANEGRRDKMHDHSLAHNLATMSEAVSLNIKKAAKSGKIMAVDVEVVNVKAGHSIPTGTPRRKLVVEARSQDTHGNVIETKKVEYRKLVVTAEGEEISSDGDVFLHGAKIQQDNRLAPGERRIEKITFARRLDDVVSVAVDAYFLYEPEVVQQVEMRIPFAGAQATVR